MRACTVVAGLGVFVGTASAQEVWSGFDFSFSKAAFADFNLPENQDRITDNVWLTRKTIQGLFNIKTETGYVNDFSPADTEWAYGSAADWPTLNFRSWEEWHDGNPPRTVGRDAVVHLISDDIYIDIRFTAWGITGADGGSFAYVRGVRPVCAPDLTGEGDVNINDFFLFLSLYQAMDPRADFAPGGGININDFFAFLAAYQAGC